MKIVESGFECRRDNLTVRGLEFRPSETVGELPGVIISHGMTANYDSVRRYAEKFADWGYAAYCFDFCGGCTVGRSDGDSTDMSVLTEVSDLRAVMGYVRGLDYVSGEKVLLMGCSQGGFVSALAAASVPEFVSGLILFYPAFSIPDDARRGSMLAARFDPHNIPERMPCGSMTIGRAYPETMLDKDPYKETSGYPGPVLIVHGTADSIVDPAYSERAYDAYTGGRYDLHPDKRLVLLEGAKHGFSGEYYDRALAYLRDFLDEVPVTGGAS